MYILIYVAYFMYVFGWYVRCIKCATLIDSVEALFQIEEGGGFSPIWVT